MVWSALQVEPDLLRVTGIELPVQVRDTIGLEPDIDTAVCLTNNRGIVRAVRAVQVDDLEETAVVAVGGSLE